MPFLSFIVGFRNRDTQRLTLFLESLKAMYNNDFELIFVDYGSDEAVSADVKTIVENYVFAKYFFFNSRGQNWNRAKCLNYAYKKSNGQYIFTSDIDFLYHKSFISIVKSIINPQTAYYFKVGFLSQKQSQNITIDSENYDIENYSDKDAIGALLISRPMFDEVGGFDEFYEIWGVEDNDLLHRIRMTNNKIEFFEKKILVWHIWHLPVKQTSVLPEGWLKFLGDYFEAKKQTIILPNQNYYCKNDENRPVLNNKKLKEKTITINCSEKFLVLLIKNELQKLTSDEILCVKFNFSQYNSVLTSRVNKLVDTLNNFFKRIKTPLHVQNINMQLYLSPNKAIEQMQYFIKYNRELIKDFYLPENVTSEPIRFIKN